MHLSFEILEMRRLDGRHGNFEVPEGIDILDNSFFYSVPTSFFVLDKRVPSVLRALLAEAEGCLKSNFLTGASACIRKIVYELAKAQGVEGDHYDDRIRALKEKLKEVDPAYFDMLLSIQRLTSSKVHENAHDGWEGGHVRLILATLKETLQEVYVAPAVRNDRLQAVMKLGQTLLVKEDS